jgi:spore coat polysaccharide biosynthesis protein SpsF (cytidylyltransferase family)
VASVQARIGSTRLPRKVLAEIGGEAALARVLARAAAITGVDAVALAIPRDASDDMLADIGTREGVPVIRGSRDDVLDRFVDAAAATSATAVVRITGDCPLLDPAISGAVVARFLDEGVDYASNVHPPTFPDGYDTEVLTVDALNDAWREAADPFEREHVTPFIWRRPERFRLANVAADVDRSSWRLTLDTEADLARIRAIWRRAGADPMFGLQRVAELVASEPAILEGAV